MLRLGEERTVHVGVTARFEHQRSPEMVVMFAHPLAALQHRTAFDVREAVDDQAKRLACGVRVNRANRRHSEHRAPGRLLVVGAQPFTENGRKTSISGHGTIPASRAVDTLTRGSVTSKLANFGVPREACGPRTDSFHTL
jgi:hypothetical protein